MQFNFNRSQDFLIYVENTEARKNEASLCSGKNLRGKLVFADSFVHGRTSKPSPDLITALQALGVRLKTAGPRTVSSSIVRCWRIFTDAAYEQGARTGGLGGVLFDDNGTTSNWIGIEVSEQAAFKLGSQYKQSLIYDLEMAASIVALQFGDASSNLHVCYGDNDSARFSLIRASGSGEVACSFLAKFFLAGKLNKML